AFASSLDQVGPFSVGVEGTAMALQAIAGVDKLDATTAPVAVSRYRAALQGGIKGLRVGIPREYFVEGTEPDVARLVRAAIDKLAELGAEIDEVSLPNTDYGLATYYI